MSKEKYQEALSNYFTAKLQFDNEMYKSMELLEELVDTYPEYLELKAKATPFKAFQFEYEEEHYYICPKCTTVEKITEIENIKYCRFCGQRLELE
jgi:hypothetical protein